MSDSGRGCPGPVSTVQAQSPGTCQRCMYELP